MATLPLSSLSDPTVSGMPPLSKPSMPESRVKKPKLPKTTKIDVITGKGTPGGFKGASTKNPKKESTAIQGDITKIQQSQPTLTNLEEKRSNVRAIESKKTELKVANRAPDFSKGVRVQ